MTKTERSLATVQMFLYSKYLLRIEDFRSQNAACLFSLQSIIRRITEVSLVKMANQWAEGEDVTKRKDKHQVRLPLFLDNGTVFSGNSANNSKKNEIIDGCH